MRLKGACTLLTGAGSGIGRALSIVLAAKGARLLLADLHKDTAEETRTLLVDNSKAIAVGADVSSADGRAILLEAAEQHFGRLDLLINNAGVITVAPVDDTSDDNLQLMVNVNLLAPMAIVREFTPLLEGSSPSRVVNIGSMFGDIGFPLFAAYSATKFGIRGFSDALRREFKAKGISVTYVAPRAAKTPAAAKFEHLVEPFKMTFDAPEAVARHIVSGIEKNKRSIYPMGPERLFVLIQRLFPGIIDSSLVSQLANVNKK